jgi:hypothetical protein
MSFLKLLSNRFCKYLFFDHYFDGNSNDLSSFGADLSEWANVKAEVKNRVMKIFLNDKLIRQETYKEDAGEVVGLRFSFLGAGTVKNIKLLNGKEEKVYNNLTDDN